MEGLLETIKIYNKYKVRTALRYQNKLQTLAHPGRGAPRSAAAAATHCRAAAAAPASAAFLSPRGCALFDDTVARRSALWLFGGVVMGCPPDRVSTSQRALWGQSSSAGHAAASARLRDGQSRGEPSWAVHRGTAAIRHTALRRAPRPRRPRAGPTRAARSGIRLRPGWPRLRRFGRYLVPQEQRHRGGGFQQHKRRRPAQINAGPGPVPVVQPLQPAGASTPPERLSAPAARSPPRRPPPRLCPPPPTPR